MKMAINPSKNGSVLNDPTKRANDLNDPKYSNEQGYFPYDLTHQEFITPRFGEITPSMHLHTVSGDRIVMHDNMKTVHTRINGNFLSTINQYVDTIFVPMRSYMPTNYEKFIPNPTKGDDLPNMALPMFDIQNFIWNYLHSTLEFTILRKESINSEPVVVSTEENSYIMSLATGVLADVNLYNLALTRFTILAYVLSRGQLLDYLGCAFDHDYRKISVLQELIDAYFMELFDAYKGKAVYEVDIDLRSNTYLIPGVYDNYTYYPETLPEFRDMISSSIERGKYLYSPQIQAQSVYSSMNNLVAALDNLFPARAGNPQNYVLDINTSSNPFEVGFINIEKLYAYQLSVAQYFTNDSVDNIFNADLFNQLFRSVLYPADDNGITNEPTFDYNGVSTEYDYISLGSTYYSFIKNTNGSLNRMWMFLSLIFVMRRSLRYGDYFSTARPNMLAVGQLEINVTDGKVSPIDVTKNLLMQRYLNAVNYIGSGFMQYMASIFGVTPTDTGSYPRYVAHRTIPLASDITVNTASEQGKQSTNLVGYTDDSAFDVFIDDFGVLINVVSYDVLPVYKSGIENTYHFADRFDYFNPMMQNIGDQPIRQSEIIGKPSFRDIVFGYTMRDAQYKFKLSRAHGGFVNDLPGFLLSFPISSYLGDSTIGEININPDFIRDKPFYMDSIVSQQTGFSPAQYYHFIVSCTNVVKTARKIQATPPVLF